MFAYKSIECLNQLFFNSLNSYVWYFSNLEIWNHEKKKGKKESNFIVLAYIADVSVSTNPSYVCEHCLYTRQKSSTTHAPPQYQQTN